MEEESYIIWNNDGLCLGVHTDSADHYRKKGYRMLRESDALDLASGRGAATIISNLLRFLPDGEGTGAECWGYCWEELDEKSQDIVGVNRREANDFLKRLKGSDTGSRKCPKCGSDEVDYIGRGAYGCRACTHIWGVFS